MQDPLEEATLASDGTPGCPVTVLLVATKMEAGAHNMLASLRRYGYRYRVLGWGQPWEGWRQRMAWYRDSAKEYAPDELLLYVDAYDAVAARPWAGIDTVFADVAGGAGLVTGTEALCTLENCGNLKDWWAATRRTPATPYKFINGGVIMGRASAIAAAYDWVLADARHFTDDQIGLAAYATAHPDAYAPDDGRRIVSNKHAWHRMTGDERAGAGAYFLHYPGVNKAPIAYPIGEAWAAHAGRLAVMRMPTSPMWETLRVLLPLAAAVLVLALGFALGFATGRATAKAAKAGALSLASPLASPPAMLYQTL